MRNLNSATIYGVVSNFTYLRLFSSALHTEEIWDLAHLALLLYHSRVRLQIYHNDSALWNRKIILCFVDRTSLYNLVNRTNSVHNLFLVYLLFRYTIIKQKMNVLKYLLDDIKTKQLQWYGHVQRIEEGRLPKEVMKWSPLRRRTRGRHKLTWAEGIRGPMGEKRLMEEDWNDRDNWRK